MIRISNSHIRWTPGICLNQPGRQAPAGRGANTRTSHHACQPSRGGPTAARPQRPPTHRDRAATASETGQPASTGSPDACCRGRRRRPGRPRRSGRRRSDPHPRDSSFPSEWIMHGGDLAATVFSPILDGGAVWVWPMGLTVHVSERPTRLGDNPSTLNRRPRGWRIGFRSIERDALDSTERQRALRICGTPLAVQLMCVLQVDNDVRSEDDYVRVHCCPW